MGKLKEKEFLKIKDNIFWQDPYETLFRTQKTCSEVMCWNDNTEVWD